MLEFSMGMNTVQDGDQPVFPQWMRSHMPYTCEHGTAILVEKDNHQMPGTGWKGFLLPLWGPDTGRKGYYPGKEFPPSREQCRLTDRRQSPQDNSLSFNLKKEYTETHITVCDLHFISWILHFLHSHSNSSHTNSLSPDKQW